MAPTTSSQVIALYCRISVDREGRREGVEDQERWGREYAAERWPGTPVRVFVDNDLSAARDDVRPGYEAFRAAVRAGEVAHVWAVMQSRLERRVAGQSDWFDLAAELIRHGIDVVHTRRDGLVVLDDVGTDIKAVLNARYVRDLKKSIRDKVGELARQGRPSGAVVFGYRHGRDELGRKALIIVDEQADAVRWAAEAFLSGWSLTAIADELTARGFTGAQGKPLRVGSIRSIFSSPTVAGRRVHQGVDVGPGTWEPILDADTYQAVRARLASARTIRRRDGRDHAVSVAVFDGNRGRTGRRYVLTSGLSVCGECGAPLAGCQVDRAAGRVAYLRCQPSKGGKACVGVAMEPVERHVADAVFDALDTPGFLSALSADEHAHRRDEVTRALSAIDGQRAELAEMWGAGDMNTEEWKAARAGLDTRENTLRGELLAMPAAPARLAGIEGARAAWPHMTLGERREFLRLFVEKVTVNRAPRPGITDPTERVEITWKSA